MSYSPTEAIHAASLGLSMAQRRAEVAATNIALRGDGTRAAQRVDFSQQLGLLQRVARGGEVSPSALTQAAVEAAPLRTEAGPSSLDHEVAELATAQLQYQSLAEAVNRHFALTRLALSGRAGA
jgi:flagellar basal body rod protein FlgB